MAEWKPASVADSRLQSVQCSNPGAKIAHAAYTFGHGIAPGTSKCSASEDMAAAVWWKGDHKPTTNDARNSDVADFWTQSKDKGNIAGAIQQVTGTDIAKQVKEAGRGSHVTLGFQGNEFTRTSKYKAEFCEKHEADGGQAIKPITANMYFQAKKDARANKALGTGSSVNLSMMS